MPVKIKPRSFQNRFYLYALKLLIMIAKNTYNGQYSVMDCHTFVGAETLADDLYRKRSDKP